MSKIAVVYWSGTGNTEAMASAVLQGIKKSNAEGILYSYDEFSADLLKEYEAVAFGCPAMGDEVLEESEFEPMFESCVSSLSGKKVALFGSYGWGDGEWMRSWEERCENNGIHLVGEGVICNEMPDEEGLMQCEKLGERLVEESERK